MARARRQQLGVGAEPRPDMAGERECGDDQGGDQGALIGGSRRAGRSGGIAARRAGRRRSHRERTRVDCYPDVQLQVKETPQPAWLRACVHAALASVALTVKVC